MDVDSSVLFLFLVMASIWGVCHWWVHRRLLPRRVRMGSTGRWLAGGLVAHFTLTIAVFALRDLDPNLTWVRWFKTTGYLALGGFSMLVVLLVLRDVLIDAPLWVRRAVLRRGGDGGRSKVADSRAVNEGRRAFLRGGTSAVAATAALVGTGIGHANVREFPRTKRVRIPVPDLHSDLEGLRIVQLSDVHLGPTVEREFLEKLVEVTNALEPDIVAITGDLVDGRVSDMGHWLDTLGALEAPLGSWFVTGNHEYYWNAPEWVARVAETGTVPLINEHRVLWRGDAKIAICGVTDYSAGEMEAGHATDPDAALRGVPDDAFTLLLAHQPNTIYRASELGADLQLSGHTHGGQFYPWNFVVGWVHAFAVGLHRMRDTRIYVSRGTAWWGPPMRLGAPAEVSLLELTRGS